MILELLFLSLIADFIHWAVIRTQLRSEMAFVGTLRNPRPRCVRICALVVVHARLPYYGLSEKVGPTFVHLMLNIS